MNTGLTALEGHDDIEVRIAIDIGDVQLPDVRLDWEGYGFGPTAFSLALPNYDFPGQYPSGHDLRGAVSI